MNYNKKRNYKYALQKRITMVVEYLEKIRDKYNEERIELSRCLNDILKLHKENYEFIKVLQVNEDTNFESFTPREVNSFNKKKILELKENQKYLENKMEEISSDLQKIDEELEEIRNVIKIAKENYC